MLRVNSVIHILKFKDFYGKVTIPLEAMDVLSSTAQTDSKGFDFVLAGEFSALL